MRGIELQIESRESAVQRLLKKMAKKGESLEVTGHMVQAGSSEDSSMVIVSRSRSLVILGNLIGGIPIPYNAKKEIAFIKLPPKIE